MSDLLELADRCEQEAPSRELDGEIMFSLFAKPADDQVPTRHYLWPEDNASWSFAIRFPGWKAERIAANRRGQETIVIWRDGDPILLNSLRIKPVTFGLDAAVTLVPENVVETVLRIYQTGVYARITLASGAPVYCEALNNPKITPALALCAVALRARAEMEKADE